jgi:hypothetical protein
VQARPPRFVHIETKELDMRSQSFVMWIALGLAGCVPPSQPTYPPAYAGSYQAAPQPGPAQADPAEPVYEAPPPTPARARKIKINGVALGSVETQTLARLEAAGGVVLPDGAYWYDAFSGAFGVWGQPAGAFIGAGHRLGPPVPARASNGTSGVFINGRQLQHGEVAFLSALIQYPWQPGRYFVDAQGNAGLEGGPVLVNLVAAAQTHQRASAGGGGSVHLHSGYGSNQSWFSSENGCKMFMDSKGNSISSGC